MTDAIKTNDPNDLIASCILFELVPHLTKEVDADETEEDTFVKTYIDCFLDNIFSADERFYQLCTQSELGHFGALFTGLMQVKNIALDISGAIEEIEEIIHVESNVSMSMKKAQQDQPPQ